MDEFDPEDFDPDDVDVGLDRHAPWEHDRLFRATLHNGTLTLADWRDGLAEGGPLGGLLHERAGNGVVIVDLRVPAAPPGERDLIVEVMTGESFDDAARSALRRWAWATGYRRIWLPDGPIDLNGDPPPIGAASVTCRTCGADWRDCGTAFWLATRDYGHFPRICTTCGNTLAQWELETPRRT